MRLPDTILDQKVIPVARGLDGATAPRMVEALARGGINSIEITIESAGSLGAVDAVAGSEFVVGVGTVMSVPDAERAVSAGAEFLVSPHLDPELLQWATENDVVYLPGAHSPTEVAKAWSLRPAAVKLFPASLGGPGYLRGLFGPFPDVSLVPTGGIDDGNIRQFLDAGAIAVGVGGWLTSHDDHAVVTERAAALRSLVV
ncbi:MAG TPA: bifunctional 4-hydroxy-2-oxoglutarate aldolase/2-dehydro-3-deoxy-phosphogluconate aldolase [Acidimicrobiia bacterium]|nr:bifunctional 4-hydroxy-2-oxoglutarate aldolase/2-dehydro-3-deoxy-phosphogluconate aldolase [Acidimicrobiia bacterium]